MYDFIVCGVFKNEAHILSEWIQHYIQRGVEHFYLVNDHSTDDFEKVLSPFSAYVTLFHNDIVTDRPGRQVCIYEKYFVQCLRMAKWMAILDLDEFMYSPSKQSFSNILSTFDKVSQIQIDWLHFGSNGHIHQPASVVSGFTKRGKHLTTAPYYSFKSIFKTNSIISFGIHSHSVNGQTIHFTYSDEATPPLVINHYQLQSLEFFMKVKATRGDADNYAQSIGVVRDRAYFDAIDVNDVEDLRLFEQNKSMISLNTIL